MGSPSVTRGPERLAAGDEVLMKRRIAILLAATAALFVVSPLVWAHYIYESGYTWENGAGKCLWARAEISHGNGGGYAKIDVSAWRENEQPGGSVGPVGVGGTSEDCADLWTRLPGYLRQRNQLWYHVHDWAICRRGTWTYNTTNSYTMPLQERWYGTSPRCGNAWYTNVGGTGVYFDSAWKKGYVISGCHIRPGEQGGPGSCGQ